MTAAFVPYSKRAPKTTDLRALREELATQRAEHGPRSSEVLEAFERLFREAARQGRPLDGLRRYSPDEAERFFDRVRYGAEGHAYWEGRNAFRRNDDRNQVPRRWWWERLNGETSQWDDVIPACGELKCINPEHCITGRDLRRRKYTDEMMIAALQVFALRNNQPPTMAEWDESGYSPSTAIYKLRFGSWIAALEKAGLSLDRANLRSSVEMCIESLREAARVLGRPPTYEEFRSAEMRAHLEARGLPRAINGIRARLGGGGWHEILARAGLK